MGSEYMPTLAVCLQFSKEKYILDSSPEKLHKELEEELKLSSTDLRSHAWYHGRIPREVSVYVDSGWEALSPQPSTHHHGGWSCPIPAPTDPSAWVAWNEGCSLTL